MITLGDAILAINPDAEFEYEDIDKIWWQKKLNLLDKEEILSKYKELKEIEKEKIAFEKANRKGYFWKNYSLVLDKKNLYLQLQTRFSNLLNNYFFIFCTNRKLS